jgi:ABC-type uncharacterized transport system auxiliary subunit
MNCGSVPPTYYYKIHYDLTQHNSPTPLPITIGIEPFDSDILYKGDRIVYRNSEYEVQFYHYRRWIAPPNKIAYESTLEQFRSSGIFQNVVKYPSTSEVDYILTGKIKAFEEWDENNTWYGIVSIAFELRDKKNSKTIWQNTFTEKTNVLKKEPKEVVKAISESLKKVVKKAIQEIGQTLH